MRPRLSNTEAITRQGIRPAVSACAPLVRGAENTRLQGPGAKGHFLKKVGPGDEEMKCVRDELA